MGFYRFARQTGVDREIATQKLFFIQTPKHDLGVSHSWLRAAIAVARRTGGRARRTRTNPEGPAGIHIGNGATARANGIDVDHRH